MNQQEKSLRLCVFAAENSYPKINAGVIARGRAPKPTAGPSTRLRTGFTLIEIMVVLLIIAITIGMVGINLQRGDNNRAQEEADRIVILLQAAREEAILQGQVFAVQFSTDGYRFLRLNNKGKLEQIEKDDVLSPRSLPDGVTLSFTMDGAAADTEAGLVLDPSGSFIPFVLTLRAGEARWQALGLANGKIQSKPPEPLHAG
ncbi:MAG TPA: type II secretion system minor pseudopilin GspH [Acidiferrobacterales bacterium]|nr:type II secretion system minor pseudopilin GspH [Acidiferrobacterales bacterium]